MNKGADEANQESYQMAHISAEREVLDRLRRMETRLVKLMEHLGFDSQRKLPEFDPVTGIMQIPSWNVAIIDILNAIPAGRENAVTIWHKEHRLCLILKEEAAT